jgi:hypothetical protein
MASNRAIMPRADSTSSTVVAQRKAAVAAHVAAREGLIPDRAKAHNIGADVRDADWLNNVPTDRPL